MIDAWRDALVTMSWVDLIAYIPGVFFYGMAFVVMPAAVIWHLTVRADDVASVTAAVRFVIVVFMAWAAWVIYDYTVDTRTASVVRRCETNVPADVPNRGERVRKCVDGRFPSAR